MKRKAADDANTNRNVKWDDILCPICMEHPHNAVILRCSSYKNGCKAFICDTSYMHSNCLDRFVEQNGGPKSWHSLPSSTHWSSSGDFSGANLDVIDGIQSFYGNGSLNSGGNDTVTSRGGMNDYNSTQDARFPGAQSLEADHLDASWGRITSQIHDSGRGRITSRIHDSGFSRRSDAIITCPFCRGLVNGWEIAVEGRKHLNLLKRSCSHDGCSFSGNYRELRQHTRNDHFGTNPVNTYSTQHQSWHHLEQQRERDDIISALHSATPDAVVVGDYVIERGDRQIDEDEEDVDQPWLDMLYILRMINSVQSESSRPWRSRLRHRPLPEPPSQLSRMPGPSEPTRFIWGENLLGIQDDAHAIALQDISTVNTSNEPDGDHPPA